MLKHLFGGWRMSGRILHKRMASYRIYSEVEPSFECEGMTQVFCIMNTCTYLAFLTEFLLPVSSWLLVRSILTFSLTTPFSQVE